MTGRERLALVLGLGLTLAVRLVYLALVQPLPVRSDASGYDAAARRLISTGSYAFPVGSDLWHDDVFREDAWPTFLERPANAWAMPGYPGFVAGLYRIFGAGPERYRPVRLTQALLSSLTVALCFWIARRMIGPPAGWVALALNALYPPNVWTTQYLLTETVFALMFTGQVALMVRATRSRSLFAYALVGVATAAAVYVRPVAAISPVGLVAFEGYRWLRRSLPRMAIGPLCVRFALSGLAFGLLISPWVIRNRRLYGAFVPTTSAASLPGIQGDLTLRGLPVPMAAYAQTARPGITGNDDHRYAEWIAAQVKANAPRMSAGDLVRLQLARARMLGQALTTPFTFSGPPVRVGSWPFAMQAVILALALVGLWNRRANGRPLMLLGGILSLHVLVYWSVSNLWSRYLYPLMPLVLVLAAGGCVALAGGGTQSPSAAAGSAAAATGVARPRR